MSDETARVVAESKAAYEPEADGAAFDQAHLPNVIE